MAFKTKANSNNTFLSSIGTVVSSVDSFILTVEDGYSTTKPAKVGYFAKVDVNGKLELSDGTGSIGVAVQESTNLGINCTDNPIQSYCSHGLIYVGLKAGITPKRGDYVKVDATGLADVGAVTDPFIGRFQGIYGEPTADATPIKTMQIQIGGM